MKPKTLSPTAVAAYESCPAYYRALYIRKARTPPGDPALRGNVVHGALQDWVEGGFHRLDWEGDWQAMRDKMTDIVTANYWKLFSHGSELNFCIQQCHNWLDEADFSDREVLLTEQKLRFDIPTSAGKIPFSFVIDRLDDLGDGEYDVVDYKTWVRNLKGHDLEWNLQARSYALGCWIKFRDAQRIWVSFDQTRWRPARWNFSRSECERTWKYLKNVAERILADKGSEEKINPNCRYCPRTRVCKTFKTHASVGGSFADADMESIAKRRRESANAIKALEDEVRELDMAIVSHADDIELEEFDLGETRVEIVSSKKRELDARRFAQLVDVTAFVREFGSVSVTSVDKAIKQSWFEPAVIPKVAALLEERWSAVRVKTEPISPVEAEQ